MIQYQTDTPANYKYVHGFEEGEFTYTEPLLVPQLGIIGLDQHFGTIINGKVHVAHQQMLIVCIFNASLSPIDFLGHKTPILDFGIVFIETVEIYSLNILNNDFNFTAIGPIVDQKFGMDADVLQKHLLIVGFDVRQVFIGLENW